MVSFSASSRPARFWYALDHAIGQGTGEWQVPLGGMGVLVNALLEKAPALGVVARTCVEVIRVDPGKPASMVYFLHDGKEAALDARTVLFNTSSNVVNQCLPGAYEEDQVEGSVFKQGHPAHAPAAGLADC